jgi:hypothetical protein
VVVKTFMDLILLGMEDDDEIAAEISMRGERAVEEYREESAEGLIEEAIVMLGYLETKRYFSG